MSGLTRLPEDIHKRRADYRKAVERAYETGSVDNAAHHSILKKERLRIGLAEWDASQIEEEYLQQNVVKLVGQMQTRLNKARARIQELERSSAQDKTCIQELETSSAQNKTRIQELEKSLVQAEAQNQKLEELRVRAETRNQKLEKSLVQAEARIQELEESLAQLPASFPWHDSLIVAKRKGRRFVRERFDLLSPIIKPDTRGQFLAQCTTYVAPNETTVRAIVVRSANQQASEEVVYAVELEVIKQPFTIQYVVRFPNQPMLLTGRTGVIRAMPQNPEPILLGDGAEVIRRLSPTEVNLSKPLPRLVEKAAPLDIAFLLDGSMAKTNFERAQDFLMRMTRALAKENISVRLGCVVYGEYKHTFRDRRTWKSDLEVVMQQFGSPSEFEKFLTIVKCLTPFQHDYCDALELGLLRVKTDLEWSASVRHLILIGNSPPHPTNQERRQYNLFDRTTDEFYNINWSDELKALKKQGKLYLSSIWVEPTDGEGPQSAQRQFAQFVWRTLGKDSQLDGLDGSSSKRLLDLIWDSRQKSLSMEGPLQLPLLVPLSLNQ